MSLAGGGQTLDGPIGVSQAYRDNYDRIFRKSATCWREPEPEAPPSEPHPDRDTLRAPAKEKWDTRQHAVAVDGLTFCGKIADGFDAKTTCPDCQAAIVRFTAGAFGQAVLEK